MRVKRIYFIIVIIISCLALFIIFRKVSVDCVVVPSPQLTNWAKHKVIVFESDDWGLCEWVSALKFFDILSFSDSMNEYGKNKNDISISLIWGKSTLESPEDLEKLFKILEKYKDGNGRHPVFQPNYIMSSPDYKAIIANGYKTYQDLVIPNVPSLWQRGNFVVKAKEGIERGIWFPEYHGNRHFNSFKWMEVIKAKDKLTLESFKYQTFINGYEADNYEYDPKLPYRQQIASITTGIERFYKIFGYYPHSSIAPNYTWQAKTEKALAEQGIKVIQAKNNQHLKRNIFEMVRGKIVNLLGKKFADKTWQIAMGDYNPKLKLYYLNRNVDFEPRGKEDANTEQGAEEAYEKIISAWQRNEPAIINSHRINYLYLVKEWAEGNLKQLDWLLKKIQTEHPDAVYLTDWEVAQLYEDGTSVLHFGNDIVCRNFTNINQLFKVNIAGGKQVNTVCLLPENKPLEFNPSKKDIIFTVPAGKTCVVELANKE